LNSFSRSSGGIHANVASRFVSVFLFSVFSAFLFSVPR
jgi:hypothetical protein